jgi:hypothetical protein
MVLKLAKQLGFETQEEYFEYILESRKNGNHKQARELFSKLSDGMQGEKASFWNWLGESFCSIMSEEETREFFSEWRDYLHKR